MQANGQPSPLRAILLSSVSRLEAPMPDDYGDIRFEISRRLLGRVPPMQPVVMRHPWTGRVIFVEGEPDNWREFIEGAMADGTLPQVLKAAAIAGRAN